MKFAGKIMLCYVLCYVMLCYVMLCYVNTGQEVRYECESTCSQTDAIYELPYGLTDSLYVTSGSLMDITCGSPSRDAHYEPPLSQTQLT